MVHPVKWIMDPLEYEWTYDAGAQAIVAMTTIVVRIYCHLGRMHEVVELDPPLALTIIPEAPPAQPIAP